MPENVTLYIGIYLIAVSILAIGLTIYDKRAAKCNLRRIRERTLLLMSAIGGSVAMLTTMLFIRHKTQHKKFMVGIPVIIFLQITVVLLIWWRTKGGV